MNFVGKHLSGSGNGRKRDFVAAYLRRESVRAEAINRRSNRRVFGALIDEAKLILAVKGQKHPRGAVCGEVTLVLGYSYCLSLNKNQVGNITLMKNSGQALELQEHISFGIYARVHSGEITYACWRVNRL